MLKIRNWSKWQSYRSDRGQPPWIKIHREVLRNPEWVSLTDAQRGQLLAMWILAADKNGELPENPTVIKKLCYMDSEPCLKTFIECGFIECDASTTPSRRQSDQPETEKRQRRGRVEEKNPCALSRFDEFWKAYPKKKNKGQAEKAFKRINGTSLDTLLSAIESAKKSPEWTKENGQYIPYPATWLNAKGWEDEAIDIKSGAEQWLETQRRLDNAEK